MLRIRAPMLVYQLCHRRRICQWIHVWYSSMAHDHQADCGFLKITSPTDNLVVAITTPQWKLLTAPLPLSVCFLLFPQALISMHMNAALVCIACSPSPTLSPTDPVPRGLLTLRPGAY